MSTEVRRTVTKKEKKSSEQLSQDLAEVQKAVKYINEVFLAMIPADHSITVGDSTKSRAQLNDQVRNIEKTLTAIRSQVKRGVRKSHGVVHDSQGNVVETKKRNGGLDKPCYIHKELVTLLTTQNLGNVDPTNPKSEKLNEVLKRSIFGKKHIGTPNIVVRLLSILVRTNKFIGKTEAKNTSCVKFPDNYLQKHIPTVFKALKEADFDVDNILWIFLSKIAQAGIVNKTTYTEAQVSDLAAEHASLEDLKTYVGDVKTFLEGTAKGKADLKVATLPSSLALVAKNSPKKTKNN
jgi:hypothetical protein